jgi:hypothetical protein
MALIDRLPPEALELVEQHPFPDTGTRRDNLLEVANFAAQAGFTNHEILQLLEGLADRWGCSPPPTCSSAGRNSSA